MLIFRYLAKEVTTTLLALTAILLLIFMSNQVVGYLNRAASGNIPGMLIMQLMLLELPYLLSLLLPLGFYMALLLAYGRLYAENEMLVLQASGYGQMQLLKHSLYLAIIVALITVMLILASPLIAYERAKLLQATGIKPLIQTIVPGRFRAISNGQYVFYVETMPATHNLAKGIFFARFLEKQSEWDVLWADQARLHNDELVLLNGKKYQGTPGKLNYQTANFLSYTMTLPHPSVKVQNDIRTISFTSLWKNKTKLNNIAELEWRISIPLMVLVLTLVAVPLSRVNPRAGKYAKLLPAILLYILYANFMFISRNALTAGKLPVWIGIFGVHLIIVLIGIYLLWQNRLARV